MKDSNFLADEIHNKDFYFLKKELVQANANYDELFNNSPISYFTINSKKKIISVNLEGAALVGVNQKLLTNQLFLNFVAMNSQPTFNNHIKQVLEFKGKDKCEIELLKIKKPRLYVKIDSFSLSHELIFMSLTDVTAVRAYEVDVLEYKKKLALWDNLFQSTSEAMAALDLNLFFTSLNQAFTRFFSRTFATRIKCGMSLLSILADFPELKMDILTACEKAKSGIKSFITVRNDTDNNETFYYYEVFFAPFYEPGTQKTCGITIDVHDLSAYKWNQCQQAKQQALLAHATRMNAAGEMAAALAHEINQPLSAINMYSHGCLHIYKNEASSNEKIINGLEQIYSLTLHAGEILHRMKNFIREGELILEQTDINTLIEQALNHLSHKKMELKFQVILKLDKMLPFIPIDRLKIIQVILNLTQNSIEAAVDAHSNLIITIETHEVNNYIEVHVKDNGPGISSELAEKIMNSYFTSKSHGTGLGLSICRTLVEAHRGKLIINPCSTGAWFNFTLPCAKTDSLEFPHD